MSIDTISRRTAFTGLVSVAALTAVAAAATTAQAHTVLDPKLAAMIAAADQLGDVSTDYYNDVYEVANDACHDEIANLPHHDTAGSFVNIHNVAKHLTTSDRASVETARRALANLPSDPRRENEDWVSTVRELVALADQREAAVEAIERKHRIAAIGRMSDFLMSRHCRAMCEVVTYPVTSLADLCVKIDFIESRDAWEFPDTKDGIVADIRRLGGLA